MAAPWYDAEHRRTREAHIRSGYWIGAPCPRCGEPMWPGQKLDLGHVVDVAEGGAGSPLRRLEHAACNRRAGQLVAAESRKARRARERTPEEQAKHDHLVAVRMRRAWKLAEQEFEQSQHGRDWG